MNFINSFLLWTAAGATIPIIIHLLNREKPKKVDIPTVKFIIKAAQKSSKKRKIDNLFLLLTRMFILILLSLIIARPHLEEILSSKATEMVNAVIIIDNSYYTAHKSNSISQIDSIKDQAKEIVAKLPQGSLISIITAEDKKNEFTEIKTYLYEKIDQLSPAPININMANLISSASTMLQDLNLESNNKIYVLSDMNKGAWNNNYDTSSLNLKNDSIYIKPLSKRVGNIFISKVQVKSTGFSKSKKIYKRRDTDIEVKINGDRILSGLKVKLKIEGNEVDEKVILAEDTEALINFSTSFDKEGMFFCEVIIETQDSIEIDNTFYFNINVLPPINVFIANDGESVNPLIYRAALSPSGWHGKQKFNVELLSYTKLIESLEKQNPDIILLCGSLSLSKTQWPLISHYLKNGGKVILSPDQLTQMSELNKFIFPLIKSKINAFSNPVKLSTSNNSKWQNILDIDSLFDVNINHFYSLENETKYNENTPPLFFNDGKPCFAIFRINQGEMIFWGLPPDVENSDFLNSDSFPLLWHSILENISEEHALKQNLYCGLSASLYAKNNEVSKYHVQSPAGTMDQISQKSFQLNSANLLESKFLQTYIPGHYYTSSKSFRGFSCNISRSSKYFEYPKEKEFAHLIQNQTIDKNEGSLNTILSQNSLMTILIILTLTFMALEVHLANRNNYASN